MTAHAHLAHTTPRGNERRFRITGEAYQWLVYNDPESVRRFRNVCLALLVAGAACLGLLLLPGLPPLVAMLLQAGAGLGLLTVLLSVASAWASAAKASPEGLAQVAAAAGTGLEGLAVAVRAAERRRTPTLLSGGLHLRCEHAKGEGIAIVMGGTAGR